MQTLLNIAYLFCAGSVLGYILEVFYRRFFSAKRWTKPGFLYGPFLPIYGFGIVLMYVFSTAIKINTPYQWLNDLLSVLVIGSGMILIEYIAGLIFIKGMNIKLWDYSKLRGNIQGIICPLFNLIWFGIAAFYYFFLSKYVLIALDWFENNLVAQEFWLGVAYGLLLFDLVASTGAIAKLSKAAKNSKVVVSYEAYKLSKSDSKKEKKQQLADDYPALNAFVAKTKEKGSELIGRLFFKDQYRDSWTKKPKKNSDRNARQRNPLLSHKEFSEDLGLAPIGVRPEDKKEASSAPASAETDLKPDETETKETKK
jgi:uncharacterized membrane protein